MGMAVAQDIKRVSISSKRQITIPQKYFNKLGFENEADIILIDNAIVIKPTRIESSGDFDEQILSELISEGFSGEKLLAEFKKRQARVRPAVEKILVQAKAVAKGTAEYSTYNDVFREE